MKQKDNTLCPWNPLTLRFRDGRLEDEFWNDRMRHLLRRLDVIWMVQSTVTLVLVQLQLLKLSKLNLCFVGASLVQALLYATILVGAYRQPEWYTRLRTLLICFSRWNGMILFACSFSAMGSLDEGLWAFLARMLFRSTVGGLAVIPLIVQLQFRAHTLATAVGLFISLAITSRKYCEELFVPATFQSKFQTVGRGVESWIAWAASVGGGPRLHVHGAVTEEPQSCWVVVAFTDIVFGVICSGVGLYLLECYSRVRFIMDHDIDEKRKNSCARLWRKSLLMAVWVTAVSTMLAWCILRAWDDAVTVAGERLQNFHCK